MFGSKKTDLDSENQELDLIQKAAWTFVRAAYDRFKNSDGPVKLEWCIVQMKKRFMEYSDEFLDDSIRAAYVNFQIERGAMKPF